MTHAEFVAAYREGRLSVQVDAKAAARPAAQAKKAKIATKARIPAAAQAAPAAPATAVERERLFANPTRPASKESGGLEQVGQLAWGIAVFLFAFGFRYFVRSSARGFVVTRSLQDPAFYQQAVEAGILRL